MTAVSPVAIATYVLFAVAAYVFYALCMHRLAVRHGVPRQWFAWVPLLNVYLACRLAGKGLLWTVLLFIPAVNVVVFVLVCFRLAKVNGKGRLYGVSLVLPILDLFMLWKLSFGAKASQVEASEA